LPPYAGPRKPDRSPRGQRSKSHEEKCLASERTNAARIASSWSRGILARANPRSFLDRINLIYVKTAEILHKSTGPGDFDAVDLCIGLQSEVQAKVIL